MSANPTPAPDTVVVPNTSALGRPPWGIRLVVTAAALGAWFWSQSLIGARPDPPADQAIVAGRLLTESDRLLLLAAPVHSYLVQHRASANALLIVSSALVDLLGGFLLLRGTFGPSIRPLLGLILLFVLRQLCQALTALPPPVGDPGGMIWHHPGFPSQLVTYGVTNDLFFSGHTAIAVFGAIELARLGWRWWPVAALVIVFEVATVLVLWAHYTMDIYAGAITAVCMALVADRLAPAFDRALLRFAPGRSSP